MRLVACLSLIVLAGCPKAAGPTLADDMLRATPRLPAPRAGTYTRLSDTPSDPIIATLVRDHTWDASLSGAAAGLALDALEGRGGLHGWHVRQKAWEAGYPYPVSKVKLWSTPPAAPPPPDLLAFLGTIDRSVDLGFIRARNDMEEIWLVLVAAPRVSVGLQPRQAEIGDALTLPSIPGARYTVVDSAGRLYEGSLEVSQPFTLDVGGEWLFQVADAEGVAAKFPVYVDMIPPELALLEPRDAPLDDAELVDQTRAIMGELREAYGLAGWERDPLLEAAARATLDGNAPTASHLAARVGFAPDRLWSLECHAVTIEDCIDRLMWNPYHRAALVSNSRYWGLAARRSQPGVRIVALVGAD